VFTCGTLTPAVVFHSVEKSLTVSLCQTQRMNRVLGQNGNGQNGTDKMAAIESSITQAIQLPLIILLSSLNLFPLKPIDAYHLFVTCDY